MEHTLTAHLIAREEERCRALVAKDFDAVADILSPDLTHTHTMGNTENFAEYMGLLRGPMTYLSLAREGLAVRFYGNVAVMTGLLVGAGRFGDSDPVQLRAAVLQVWLEEGGRWRMVAFQSTAV